MQDGEQAKSLLTREYASNITTGKQRAYNATVFPFPFFAFGFLFLFDVSNLISHTLC
jgi:hypothetical protein